MIRPPGVGGVAFTDFSDGDTRSDIAARRRVSTNLGISESWSTVTQVHGADVIHVNRPGNAGEADALWTTEPGMPIAVFTADCFGVAVTATDAIGVAHAGWRGVRKGTVGALRQAMLDAGHEPRHGFVGPGIARCCFEVGPEVSEQFATHRSETSWGTTSVDLIASISEQLSGMTVWSARSCTRHDDRWFSHRRDQTSSRMASIGWLA